MKRLGLVLCALLWAPDALADPLAGLDVGARSRTATAAFSPRDLQRWSASSPQGLRQGLVDTGLLEALNWAGLGRRNRQRELLGAAFGDFVRARRGGVEYALAFDAKDRLQYALARVAVPLKSADPFSARRLDGLKAALQSLKRYRLRAVDRDAYANHRTWRGSTSRGAKVWARYRAERDELWVLLAP